MVHLARTGAALEVQGTTGVTLTQAGITALHSMVLAGGGHTNHLYMRGSGSMWSSSLSLVVVLVFATVNGENQKELL